MKKIKILFFLLLTALPGVAQTQSDLGVVVSACQFFAGSPLSQQEQATIVAETRNDFATNPSKAAQDIQALKVIGNQLSQMNDPFKMIEVRQQALVAMYQEYLQGKASASSVVVLKRANPMAYSADSGVLLLEADLVGTVDFLDMLQQGQGGSAYSQAQRQQLAQQIVAGFDSMPDDSKAFVICSQFMSQILKSRLQSMSAARQAQFRQQLAQQQQAQTQAPMSAGQYQVLSNISRNQHLTTMNILENMGEGGGYWDVVNKPSW